MDLTQEYLEFILAKINKEVEHSGRVVIMSAGSYKYIFGNCLPRGFSAIGKWEAVSLDKVYIKAANYYKQIKKDKTNETHSVLL